MKNIQLGNPWTFQGTQTCLNLPSIVVITIKAYLEKCTHYSLSFRETKAGTQGAQEPGAWEEQRRVLFSGLMPL